MWAIAYPFLDLATEACTSKIYLTIKPKFSNFFSYGIIVDYLSLEKLFLSNTESIYKICTFPLDMSYLIIKISIQIPNHLVRASASIIKKTILSKLLLSKAMLLSNKNKRKRYEIIICCSFLKFCRWLKVKKIQLLEKTFTSSRWKKKLVVRVAINKEQCKKNYIIKTSKIYLSCQKIHNFYFDLFSFNAFKPKFNYSISKDKKKGYETSI